MILLMYKAKVFTILFLSTVLVGVYGQTPVFLVHPVSTAAIDGTTVEFTCTAENANLALSYVVNDTVEQVFIDRGFTQSNIESLGNNTFMRNLTVTVSAALNNNSEIACVAVGIGASAAESNIATLTIQGLLSSVGDLSYTYIDSSTVNISWSPPFTLPGTYITGYNISVTSNGTITNYFTFNTNYELLLTDITNSSCNEINITVSGYNGLNGENSLLSGIYLIVPPNTDTDFPISHTISESLTLTVFVNVTNICVGNWPSYITLFIGMVDQNNSVSLLVSNITNILMAEDVLTLVEDKEYTVDVLFENIYGEFDTNSSLTFNTTITLSPNTTLSPSASCSDEVSSPTPPIFTSSNSEVTTSSEPTVLPSITESPSTTTTTTTIDHIYDAFDYIITGIVVFVVTGIVVPCANGIWKYWKYLKYLHRNREHKQDTPTSAFPNIPRVLSSQKHFVFDINGGGEIAIDTIPEHSPTTTSTNDLDTFNSAVGDLLEQLSIMTKIDASEHSPTTTSEPTPQPQARQPNNENENTIYAADSTVKDTVTIINSQQHLKPLLPSHTDDDDDVKSNPRSKRSMASNFVMSTAKFFEKMLNTTAI